MFGLSFTGRKTARQKGKSSPARSSSNSQNGILDLLITDFITLQPKESVGDALEKIRATGLRHKIIYFYVVDSDGKLIGIVPTRLLLTSPSSTPIETIALRQVVRLSADTTPPAARKAFATHKFLAFPVVDQHDRLVGILDIERFVGNLGNIHERTSFDDVYELFGVEHIRGPWVSLKSFWMRFPWLSATILSGLTAAILTSLFETTLRQTIALAFFLAMVLALNESIAMQAATIALRTLRGKKPDWHLYRINLFREMAVTSLLGLSSALVVGSISLLWLKSMEGALVLAVSLPLSIILSGLWGISVPFGTHRLLHTPKIAVAPLALGLCDITTLVIYFGVAAFIARP